MTAGIVATASLLLAGIFLTSGIAKMFDPAGVPRSLISFGVPAAAAYRFGWSLPSLEIFIGLGLLVPATALTSAVAAGALLVLFMLGIAVNLAHGRRPECHCFGRLHSAPISGTMSIRNGALAAVAFSSAWWGWQRGAPLVTWSWVSSLGWSDWLSVAAVAFASGFGMLLVALWRQQGRILNQIEALQAAGGEIRPRDGVGSGPTVGLVIPSVELVGLDGSSVDLRARLHPVQDTLIVFLSTSCGPCRALLPSLDEWNGDDALQLHTLVVATSPVEDVRRMAEEHGLDCVLADPSRSVAEAYGVHATPAALVASVDGTARTSLVTGGAMIRKLVDEISAIRSTRPPAVASSEPQVVFDRVSVPRMEGPS